MVYFRTVASSKIYIFTSYHKLFFQVLLRMKSTASLQNIFSFLLNHSCASKVGGVSIIYVTKNYFRKKSYHLKVKSFDFLLLATVL